MGNDLYPRGVIEATGARGWVWQDRGPGKNRRPHLPADLNTAIDRSVKEGGYWEKATFTVPIDTPHDLVASQVGERYKTKFGRMLEEERGLTVKRMVGPVLDLRPLPVEPDRRRYVIWAFVSQRPFQPVYDIPDACVPEMLKAGLRLLE